MVFRPKYYFENRKATKLKGGALIISNHTSVLDGIVVSMAFPFATIYSLANETIFDCNGFYKLLMKMLLMVRVDRKNHDLSFMSQTVNMLKKGEKVVMFPQGRLPDERTPLPPFMPTFVYMAKESQKPIIPVWHSEKYGIHRTKISVGTPIYIDKDACSTFEEVQATTKAIQEKLFALAQH